MHALRLYFCTLACLLLIAAPAAAAQEVDLGLIVVKSRSLAREIVSRLKSGAKFSELAKKHSVGAAAFKGGRLGKVPLRRLRPEFRAALSGLPPGRPSKIIPTEEGFAILINFGSQKVALTSPKAAKPARPYTREKPGPTPSSPHLEARSHTVNGLEAMVERKWKQAAALFAKALKSNPALRETALLRDLVAQVQAKKVSANSAQQMAKGFLALTNGQPREARGYLRKVRRARPKLWMAALWEANVQAALGQKQQARKLLASVLKINPRSEDAYLALAMLEIADNRFAEAQKLLTKALAINSSLAEAHYQLGNILLRQLKADEAERSLKAAIAANPFHEEAHNDLGLLYGYTKRFKQAVVMFKKALAINPAFAIAHVNLGNLYARQRLYSKAIAEYEKALLVNPRLSVAHANLAAAHAARKEWDIAIEHADKAVAMGYPLPKGLLKMLAPHRK